MTETHACPKCGGEMAPGSLRDRGQYGGPSPYVWSPADDDPFPLAKRPSKRLDIALQRCRQCGYLELYAAAPGE
jgi:hypothetical protein